MSGTPIKKQPIGFIFLLFICLLGPLGAAAQTTLQVEPGEAGIRYDFGIVLCPGPGTPCTPLSGSLIWSLIPNNGTATLSAPSATDSGSNKAWFELGFGPNACGTYRVRVRIARDPRPDSFIEFVISGKPPCSPGSSGETTSSSSETTSPPPPPSPQLVKISDDNQLTHPEDSVTLSVELRDSDGSPAADVDVTFWILSGKRSTVSLSPTRATTDANGRAQTTLTFSAGATGKYIIEAYRSDNASIYTQFTVTVDPLLPKATRLEKISGDNQTGLTGGVWAAPFVVEVLDQYDVPLEGTPVTFTVLTGGGILSAETTRTNANGLATSTLRLGTDAGTNTVEVSVEGISETVTFTAEALPPTLTSLSGNHQSAAVGTALANPFVVEVRDGNGNPLAGVTVTFVVRTGGGTLSPPTATTNASGQAASTLRLGTEAGPNTAEVSVEDISEPVTFTAEALPPTLTSVSGNNQSAAVGTALANPFVVEVHDGNGSPLAGVAVTFVVRTGGGMLSNPTAITDARGQATSTLRLGTAPGTNMVEVNAEGITEIVTFSAVTELLEFDLSLPSGISLIHVPLKVKTVDGQTQTIESVSDFYTALGGPEVVNWLITYDAETQNWRSYLGDADQGSVADRALTDDTGIIASIKTPVSVLLGGNALGTDGSSTLTLNRGTNLVGLSLRDSRITRVSDLFSLNEIGDNVSTIIVTDNGEFKTVGRAGDPGDIAITGGQSFILIAQRATTIGISGEGWSNPLGTTAAAPGAITGIKMGHTTPVLALSGSIVDGGTGSKVGGFRVTVKNLSTGSTVAAIPPSDEIGYRSTIVDIETGRAAVIGDILEISAESPHRGMGVKPLRYTVTAEDIKWHRIQLPPLVAYEIPDETALLHNYPNPFNPETWIPYQLAEDAFVTLTIYDGNGQVVRTFEVGHQIASAYADRSKAIYWDGRNEFGEPVASGIYFYHLSAGDFSATQRMIILK